MITIERLKEVLAYDPETGDFRWKIALGRRSTVGAIAGSIKQSGYIYIQIDGVSYAAHQLAWFYVHEIWCEVDHKDNKRWRNVLTNLRESNEQLNAFNREVVTSNSGVKGVHFREGRYEAGIKINGVRIHLGSFKTLEEATNARQNAAKEYFGEFARETEM